MAQRVSVEVPLDVAAALDEIVAAGHFRNRSEALAEAIQGLVGKSRLAEAADLRRSYEVHPEDAAIGETGPRLLTDRVREERRA